MRAFLGVEIPSQRGTPGGLDTPDHLTLRFLGEVDVPRVERLSSLLRARLAALAPFEFVVEGVGAFPSRDRPRVVWCGVGAGSADLETLARTVREATDAAGVPNDPSPFVPHVTLFRIRSTSDREAALRLLSGAVAPPAPRSVTATEVTLVESRLTPHGAHHTVLARFPLGGPGA